MDAKFITSLLAKKHKGDLWDSEVNIFSPSTQLNHRIDFWAMSSNKNIDMTAYEVKVDRNDFLNDKKWFAYKEFCNRMYFICPKDVIYDREIPGGIGLIYVYESGHMKTIKPAIHREQLPPVEFLHRMMVKHIEIFKKVHNYEVNRELSIDEYITKNSSNANIGKFFKDKLVKENESLSYKVNKLESELSEWENIIKKYTPYSVEEAMNHKKSDFDFKSLSARLDTINTMVKTYMKDLNKKFKLFLLVSPTACGKTTLMNSLLNTVSGISRVKTSTTREIRKDETEDDYYFYNQLDFIDKVKEDYFVEYSVVYGNYYGVPKHEIDRLNEHKILVIDVQGARKIRELYPESTCAIFIEPPSIEEVLSRLNKRNTPEDEINTRITEYENEIQYMGKCDYVLKYGDINKMTSDFIDYISLQIK
jgi:guanylate kinase